MYMYTTVALRQVRITQVVLFHVILISLLDTLLLESVQAEILLLFCNPYGTLQYFC